MFRVEKNAAPELWMGTNWIASRWIHLHILDLLMWVVIQSVAQDWPTRSTGGRHGGDQIAADEATRGICVIASGMRSTWGLILRWNTKTNHVGGSGICINGLTRITNSISKVQLIAFTTFLSLRVFKIVTTLKSLRSLIPTPSFGIVNSKRSYNPCDNSCGAAWRVLFRCLISVRRTWSKDLFDLTRTEKLRRYGMSGLWWRRLGACQFRFLGLILGREWWNLSVRWVLATMTARMLEN